MLLMILALAGAQAAEAAPATGSPPASPPARAAEKPAKPKLVCRTEDDTGSFISRRVCRTPEQIEAEREAAERGLQTVRGSGAGRGPGA